MTCNRDDAAPDSTTYFLLHNPVVVVVVVPPRPASLFSRSESAGPAAVPVALCVFQRGSASYNQPGQSTCSAGYGRYTIPATKESRQPQQQQQHYAVRVRIIIITCLVMPPEFYIPVT